MQEKTALIQQAKQEKQLHINEVGAVQTEKPSTQQFIHHD